MRPRRQAAWRDGAFTVGDLGRLDDEGYLFLDGRRDDLVITGGVNVYPAEVEGALCEVAGVREVAVFGVSDEAWGQRVCAAVVVDPGADPGVVVARLPELRGGPSRRVQATQAVRGGRRPAPHGHRQGPAPGVAGDRSASTEPASTEPARLSRAGRTPHRRVRGDRGATGRGSRSWPSAILVGMHAVRPGPPIATVNPATGELLESFEPMDAGTVEDRPRHRGDRCRPLGTVHVRPSGPGCW